MLKLSFVHTGQLVPKPKLRQRGRQHGKLISLHLLSLGRNVCYKTSFFCMWSEFFFSSVFQSSICSISNQQYLNKTTRYMIKKFHLLWE